MLPTDRYIPVQIDGSAQHCSISATVSSLQSPKNHDIY